MCDAADRQPEGQKPEVPFGPTLFDPDQVEATIRRAQLAILNPSVPYEQFIDYEIPDQEVKRPLGSAKQYQFSRNVVVIEITGPAVTDLTLVDLPGIIQNVAPGEDADNPKLVESLVKHYIQKDCLILLVITMKGENAPNGRRSSQMICKIKGHGHSRPRRTQSILGPSVSSPKSTRSRELRLTIGWEC